MPTKRGTQKHDLEAKVGRQSDLRGQSGIHERSQEAILSLSLVVKFLASNR